ncbi:hypothetical protein GcM1_220058, partial [Golovinomyces cichoracearum]
GTYRLSVQGRVYAAGKHPEEYDFEADKRVRTWAQNKANPVIAAAINRNCTKIDKDLFDLMRNHTNSNEQTGNKSNATGRRQMLLQAIDKYALVHDPNRDTDCSVDRLCTRTGTQPYRLDILKYLQDSVCPNHDLNYDPNTVANLALLHERLALEERINQASIESQDDNLDYQALLDVDHVPEHDLQHDRVAAQYFGELTPSGRRASTLSESITRGCSTKRARRGSSPQTRSTSRSASRSGSRTRPSPLHRAASQNSSKSFFTAVNTRFVTDHNPYRVPEAVAAQTIEDEDIIFVREEHRVIFEILEAKARQELAGARAAEIANKRLGREAKS